MYTHSWKWGNSYVEETGGTAVGKAIKSKYEKVGDTQFLLLGMPFPATPPSPFTQV